MKLQALTNGKKVSISLYLQNGFHKMVIVFLKSFFVVNKKETDLQLKRKTHIPFYLECYQYEVRACENKQKKTHLVSEN